MIMKVSAKNFQRPMIKCTKVRSLTTFNCIRICENVPVYSDKTPTNKAQPFCLQTTKNREWLITFLSLGLNDFFSA